MKNTHPDRPSAGSIFEKNNGLITRRAELHGLARGYLHQQFGWCMYGLWDLYSVGAGKDHWECDLDGIYHTEKRR